MEKARGVGLGQQAQNATSGNQLGESRPLAMINGIPVAVAASTSIELVEHWWPSSNLLSISLRLISSSLVSYLVC